MTEEPRDHHAGVLITVMIQAKGRAGMGRDGAWRGAVHEGWTGGKTAGAVHAYAALI